jgi:hypothetical protein
VKRIVLVGAWLLVSALFVFVSRSDAQVPPLPNPLATTTTAAPAPPATAAPATTSTTEVTAPADTTETTALPTDTTLPLPAETAPSLAPAPPLPRTVTQPRQVALPGSLRAASVTGAYGIGLGGVLTVALLLVMFTTIARSQITPGGSPMNARRRARLIAGLACLALAAIVGLVGYLKLSLEPDVNRQIPYLASAGMALVLLAAVGGALLVGEQMRTDEQRIDELEAAVQQLASMVAPTVEAPARTRTRTRRGAASR